MNQRPDEREQPAAGTETGSPAAIPGLELSARCTWSAEARQQAPDFYDVMPLARNRCAIWLLDVRPRAHAAPGHPDSAQASAWTVRESHALLRQMAPVESSPARVLATLNRELLGWPAQEPRLTTACYLTVRPATSGLRADVCAAGRQTALVLRADGTVLALPQCSTLLGLQSDPGLRDDRLHLRPGDGLILLAGSITGADRISSGADRIGGIAAKLSGATAAQSTEALVQSIIDLRGGQADPRVMALALKVPGGGPRRHTSWLRQSMTAVQGRTYGAGSV